MRLDQNLRDYRLQALRQKAFCLLALLGRQRIDDAIYRLGCAGCMERAENKVTGLEMTANAAAIATALVVHDCRTVLDVDTACSIAVHGLVESVKTVPAGYEQAAAAD